MTKPLPKIFANPVLLVLLSVIVKVPVFFTRHIQEDAFITWRVARNLLDFGVVGFNGEERISASTTHLYVLVSAVFQGIFGDFFIYPLLIFSCALFGIGTLLLSRIFFPEDDRKQWLLVIFLNVTPPALAASCLGMEYGILFYLYCGLIYYGTFKGKLWAYVLFPILLLWTRLDAVIFLGVFFLADAVIKKKINYAFVFGGVAGLLSVALFNYFYFGEWVNHTITAKKAAYKNLMGDNSWEFLLFQWAYYGGLIKKYSLLTLIIFCIFLIGLCFCLAKIFKEKEKIPYQAKVLLFAMAAFALIKITAFAFLRAYFDWYYWLPRFFLFVVVTYCILRFLTLKKKIYTAALAIVFLGLYLFQFMQSWAIGYMEDGQRRQIARDISAHNTGLRSSVFLEPAGIIPFFTRLYTYDEVGLVNKKITAEMLKDEKYWWINSVKKYRPDLILTVNSEAGALQSSYHVLPGDEAYLNRNYVLQKKYPIAEIHQNAPALLRRIYAIRPIGKDYYLYRKIN